jgi:Domain of unknown function (DUF5925)/ATPase family associated with various cellular activities (AAA)
MGEQHPELGLRFGAEHAGIDQGLFLARVLERNLTYMRREHWASAATLEPDGVVFRAANEGLEGRDTVVFEQDGTLVMAAFNMGQIAATVAGNSQDQIAAVMASLHERLPTPEPSSAHEVTITFWTYGAHGPQPTRRSIAVPGWDEIDVNYTGGTRAGLDRLMHRFEPARGGQLVLWHGKPGTGKTFALRALAWEWRRWCEFHYIVDPDIFFGERADYLMGVLLQAGHGEMVMHPRFGMIPRAGMRGSPRGEVGAADGDVSGPKPWRVLLLEDTGELLSADARELMGQGLSRFLNVVDGLIGQGLRVLALVTTNEEIRRLHPAVARPGRAAANVEFAPFTPEEAHEWLAARGVEDGARQPRTLAELYAKAEGVDPAEQRLVGFGDDAS